MVAMVVQHCEYNTIRGKNFLFKKGGSQGRRRLGARVEGGQFFCLNVVNCRSDARPSLWTPVPGIRAVRMGHLWPHPVILTGCTNSSPGLPRGTVIKI